MRLIKKKRERNQINKIKKERLQKTIQPEIQRIIRDYYEQLYGNKMDNTLALLSFDNKLEFCIINSILLNHVQFMS